jgi:hypothetical protein
MVVFVPFLLLVSPIMVIGLLVYLLHRSMLHFRIWLVWIRAGKDVLFVYSDSPIWREYMIDQVRPPVERRAVVLNWSERGRWPRWSLAKSAFHAYAGERNFNPMVLIFRPFRSPRVFRFNDAFKSWKHGNPGQVERIRQDLLKSLNPSDARECSVE